MAAATATGTATGTDEPSTPTTTGPTATAVGPVVCGGPSEAAQPLVRRRGRPVATATRSDSDMPPQMP